MFKSTFTRTASRLIAIAAATALAVPLLTSGPAHADPKQFNAFVAVGSDTTQSIMDALAGEANDTLYTPVKSSTASGSVQIASWDAIPTVAFPSTCITPKAPGATILRPNGSGAGRKALSRAIDGTKWGGPNCGTADPSGKAVAGLVSIARSSAGPTTGDTGTDLTYIPFARDGLAFAYYKSGGGAVASLTKAQLVSLFTTGPQVISGVNIIPCGLQTNSGTFSAWNTALGITTGQEATGTAACNAAGTGTRLEEHDSGQLKAKGDAQVGSQVIAAMGAGPFIGQWNGVAVNRTAAGVDLGTVSDNGSGTNIGKPYTGTIGTIPANLAPSASYYNDSTFGRNVYNVVDSALLGGPASSNADIKTLLVGASSAVCSGPAQANVTKFGFLTSPICGSTAITGSLIAGSI